MPNGLNIIDKIKLLTIKIELNVDGKGGIGTGVLVQNDDNYYVLTVDHVIFGHNNEFNPNPDNVTLFLQNDRLIHPAKIKKYNNLVLLKVDEYPLNLPAVKYIQKAIYDVRYYLRGYPRALQNGDSFPFNDVICSEINIDSLTLTIQNINGDSSADNTVEKMRGLSGSGVFFEELGKLYLVGLVNNLIDKHGVFNSVKAFTLIDLFASDELIPQPYKSIDEIQGEMRQKARRISEEEFEEFQKKENENFSNLDRKNTTVYDPEEVRNKNFIRVSEYANGNIIVNELADMDADFRTKWMEVLIDVLEKFDSQYGPHIPNKTIGQDRIIRMNEVVKEAIQKECAYLDTRIADKLASHAIAKWLLDCRVDFIVRS